MSEFDTFKNKMKPTKPITKPRTTIQKQTKNTFHLTIMERHYILRALKTMMSTYRKHQDDFDRDGYQTENAKTYHMAKKIFDKLNKK